MPSPDTKYLGAWNEICSRLQARENIILLFIAFTAAAIGLSMSSDALVNCSMPIGYLALAIAFLSRHHDRVIAILRRFQKEIAENDHDGKGTQEYTSIRYLGQAIRERSKREYAQVLFIIIGTSTSLYNAERVITFPFSMIAILWYGNLICSAIAIVVAIKTQRDRRLQFGSA